MERVKTRSKTVTGTNVVGNDATLPCSTQKGAALFQLNMNKISESIKAIRERLISLEQNLERLNQSHDIVVQQVTHLGALTEKLECLTSHTEQLITLSSISEELQSITQLTQEVNNIREGLTALDNVVYKDD